MKSTHLQDQANVGGHFVQLGQEGALKGSRDGHVVGDASNPVDHSRLRLLHGFCHRWRMFALGHRVRGIVQLHTGLLQCSAVQVSTLNSYPLTAIPLRLSLSLCSPSF